MKTICFKHYTLLLIALLCMAACRPMGDDLASYGQNDAIAFAEANSSFAGEFKALWLAMNENYSIWDYEEEKGIDWDEVYEKFLPKFQALDDTVNHPNKVTNSELEELYSQFLDSLHDGHLYFEIKNLHTDMYISLYPSKTRNQRERVDVFEAEEDNITNLDFYKALPSTDLYYAGSYAATSAGEVATELIDTTCQRVIRAADKFIAAVDAAGGPNKTNDSVYYATKKLKNECSDMIKELKDAQQSQMALKYMITTYNSMCVYYQMIGKQLCVEMPLAESKLGTEELKFIRTAIFKNGIAYLRFGGFNLTPYVEKPAPEKPSTMLEYYHQAVYRAWHNWFDAIQTLHAAGQLGGVIIDVRNNPGGLVSDYQYVLGALLPSGGYESHYLRLKEGIGRLDFAPILPFTLPTFPGQHEVIDDRPVVILANTHSVSMAEVTTWGVKNLKNGHFIGTRTWGGLSALNDDPSVYSQTYSGGFGVEKQTPFYGYVPRFVSLFGDDKKILEGVGITPDTYKALDVNYWTKQQRDNQLETALDYIMSH